MGVFYRNKELKRLEEQPEERSDISFALPYLGTTDQSSASALRLSTVYRCVEVISSSVAQLPIDLFNMDIDGYKSKNYDHPIAQLLGTEPNELMTRYNFIKVIVATTLLKGNAYALIVRNKKTQVPESLELINNSRIELKNNKYYLDKKQVNPANLLHFLNYSEDGINGISVLKHAKNTIGLSTNSESHAAGFFKNGANVSGILTVQGSLNKKQKDEIKNSWYETFDPVTGTPNGIAVLEGNMDFEAVSINPSDAQLLETRQFNVIDICRFFGVSPVKAMSLDTLLPTPEGWTTIEKVKVGDTLFDRYGKCTKVIDKTNIFEDEDTYKITFSDGTDATVGYDHLWVAIKAGRAKRGEKVYTTKEMFDYQEKYSKKFRIPKNEAVEYSENKNLEVDPYLLGYWLGDGCKSNNHICVADADMYVLEEFGHNKIIRNSKNSVDFGIPLLRKKLMNIGVLNNKHIPEEYKRSSKEQRLALIQGLMDTDGTVDKRDGWCYFTQVSEVIVDDFIEVCASLGIKCRKNKRVGQLNTYPDVSQSVGQDYFVVSICTDKPLFRLERKLEYQSLKKHTTKDDYITIDKIEKIDSVKLQCITVDNPTNTFLFGKSFKVTHNCFDLNKSSYSTVEATQLAFLTDTLAPLMENIELELERKLLLPSERMKFDIKFNVDALLRVDKNSLADYYSKLFNIGAITINEIRKELDLPKLDNGDKNFLQVNVQSVDNIINQTNNEDE